jgi:hypothetical protein
MPWLVWRCIPVCCRPDFPKRYLGPKKRNRGCLPLRYPEFPVEVGGVIEHHSPFLERKRTRGLVRCSVAGNPGTLGRKTFPRRVRGTADPSAALGMTKERATLQWRVVDGPKAFSLPWIQPPLFMEPQPSPLSSRAKPRDLQFYGPVLDMFFDRAAVLTFPSGASVSVLVCGRAGRRPRSSRRKRP